MTPTAKLRHVWREVHDENETLKVLALQQWWDDEDYRDGTAWPIKDKSEWRDVEIDNDNEN